MRGNWWPKFHDLWGKSKDGVYDKKAWMELQSQLEKLEARLNDLAQLPLLKTPSFSNIHHWQPQLTIENAVAKIKLLTEEFLTK